ncbi:MAG: hypothetical protein HY553_04520 [Elusimicrobia bacterium]|nr:hypothetical protein [Elusimicrobiota bacterium]
MRNPALFALAVVVGSVAGVPSSAAGGGPSSLELLQQAGAAPPDPPAIAGERELARSHEQVPPHVEFLRTIEGMANRLNGKLDRRSRTHASARCLSSSAGPCAGELSAVLQAGPTEYRARWRVRQSNPSGRDRVVSDATLTLSADDERLEYSWTLYDPWQSGRPYDVRRATYWDRSGNRFESRYLSPRLQEGLTRAIEAIERP